MVLSRLHSRSHPAVFITAIGIAAIMVYPFITSLTLAAITTYMFSPLIRKMESHKIFSRIVPVVLIVILGLPIILIASYLITNSGQILKDITGLRDIATYIIQAFSSSISNLGLGGYGDLIGAREVTAKLSTFAIDIASGFIKTIPILMLDIVIFLYATYYFMSNGQRIMKSVSDYASTLTQEDEKFISSILKGLKKSFDVLVLSYITMSVIISVVSFVVYYIFGVPHAFLLSILTGLFGFLPVFGTWMVYVPAAAYMYYIGNTFAAIGIIVFGILVLSIFIPMVIQPYLGYKQSDVNPLSILIGFFSGPIIFGPKGVIIGPIVFVVVQTIVHEYIAFRIDNEKRVMNYDE